MQQRTDSVRSRVSDEEWQVRVDLAAAYRLINHFRWDDLIFTHRSARVPDAPEQFLINPYGLFFDEITASSLVKVDSEGDPVLETEYLVNPAGFTIHSAVHEARPEVTCVIHTHTKAGIAVSAQEGGLLPISQQSMLVLQDLAYHEYEGIALREDEKPRLVADLGHKNHMILNNHGLLTCARTIPDAFLRMYTLETACQIQIMAQSGGGPLIPISESAGMKSGEQAKQATKGMGANLAWPGLLRRLDTIDASFRS